MSKHVKFLAKKCFAKAGPNTEKYGPRSEYGFLRTGCRPIRMQDSLKPYNKKFYFALLLYYGLMFLNLVGKLNACSLIWFVGWTQQ